MKTMHKLLAMVLALTLVLAMATTAFAEGEEGGTLAITGEQSSTVTYDIYQVCEVEVLDPDAKTYKYKLTDAWEGFAENEDVKKYFDINKVETEGAGEGAFDVYLNWKGKTTSESDGAAVAQLAHNYLKNYNKDKTDDQKIKPVDDVQVNNSVDLDNNGYYLLVPSNGTTCGVIVVAGKNVSIKEKSSTEGLPTVSKKVLEDSTNTYGDRNSAEVGEKITFQTTIYAGGSNVNVILHDKMDPHLRWLGGGNITRDGNHLNRGTSEQEPGDYYVVENPDDGCTFHVVFNDSLTKTLHKDATLVVNYFAVLEPDAPCNLDHSNEPDCNGNHDHKNETWLTYTEQNALSNKAETITNTYNIHVYKVNEKGEHLPGAKFVLQDNVGKYYSWADDVEVLVSENNKIYVEGVKWVDKIENATEVEEVDGYFLFKGLDAENFTLIETVVPGGYTGAGETPASTKENTTYEIATVTVKNVLGNALPETGGMGTTMFYVVGGLLAAAAVVLMLTKKRVSAK